MPFFSKNSLAFCLLLLLLGSCKSDYEKLVGRELATGLRNDSLFLGLRLAMPRKEFYEKCWELNRQKIILNGSEGTSVSYQIPPEDYTFPQPVELMFYPEFAPDSVGQILYLNGYFRYTGWAPWNLDLQADKLLPDVLKLLEKWYGATFIEVKSPTGAAAWVAVQGNRRILVDIANQQRVKVLFTDLAPPNQPRPGN